MPAYITPEQRVFFLKNQCLVLEDLLTDAQVTTLESLPTCLKGEGKELYLSGHDLFRKNKALSKISLNHSLATAFASLLEKNHLQIAFDQAFSPHMRPLLPKEPISLETLSAIKPLAGGILFTTGNTTGHPVLEKKGSALLFTSDFLLDFTYLFEIPHPLFLIAYCAPGAVFHHESHDPAIYELKTIGYEYGDKIRNDTHPLVFRA